MPERNEVLWCVTANSKPSQVFRSRATARAYVARQRKRSAMLYVIERVTWGPERIR